MFDPLVSGRIGSSFHSNHIADYFPLTTFLLLILYRLHGDFYSIFGRFFV